MYVFCPLDIDFWTRFWTSIVFVLFVQNFFCEVCALSNFFGQGFGQVRVSADLVRGLDNFFIFWVGALSGGHAPGQLFFVQNHVQDKKHTHY